MRYLVTIEIVKVVKAKRVKSLYTRVYARVKEPSHRAKREEKIWMREKGKSVRAVGDKNVRAISKNVGEKKKNVGENLEKLRRFLSNLRSLVVMLAGCAWCVGQRIETELSCLMGPRYSGN